MCSSIKFNYRELSIQTNTGIKTSLLLLWQNNNKTAIISEAAPLQNYSQESLIDIKDFLKNNLNSFLFFLGKKIEEKSHYQSFLLN